MRRVLIMAVVAVALVAAQAANAVAAEIPDATLSQLGLGEMQRMTDEQGAEVRGGRFAAVFGIGGSSAFLPIFGTASKTDGHFAKGFLTAFGSSGTQTGVSFSLFGLPVLSSNSFSSGFGFAFGL